MIVLFSGGLDSFAVWWLAAKQADIRGRPIPTALYAKIGHKYEAVELTAIANLQKLHSDLAVIMTDRLYLGDTEKSDAFIPFRNLYLTMLATSYTSQVVLGALRGENSTDKDAKFERLASELLSHCNGRKIVISRPAAHLTKTGLVRRYLEEGGPVESLKATVSCYNGGFCGKCQSCFRRWVAMSLNGIEETYDNDPRDVAKQWTAGFKKYGIRSTLKTMPSNIDAFMALRKANTRK